MCYDVPAVIESWVISNLGIVSAAPDCTLVSDVCYTHFFIWRNSNPLFFLVFHSLMFEVLCREPNATYLRSKTFA